MCERATEEKPPLWLKGLVNVGIIVMVFLLCAISFCFGKAWMGPELTQLATAQILIIKKNAEIEALKAAQSQVDEKAWNQRHDERLATSFLIEKVIADQTAAERAFGDISVVYGANVVFNDGENRIYRYSKMVDEFPDAPWAFDTTMITADNDF